MMAMNLLMAYVFAFFLTNICAAFYNQFRLGNRLVRPTLLSRERHLPTAQWFTQRLDHFNDAETRTWQQRYFVNDSFYVIGGPAFVTIGGEEPAHPIWIVDGQWINWAKQFNALCFQLEHRYYGESHPTVDVRVKNLQYLSSEQALADLATFRSAMADQYGLTDAKWIVFGGSYSGSLAAWARLKYPHLFDGAVASSAPLLAVIDFKEFLGLVKTTLANVSSTCNPAITAATGQLDQLLIRGRSGWDEITRKFRLCSPLDGTKAPDVANLFNSLCDNFQNVVQYNKGNRGFEGALATNITIETICGIMDDETIGPEIDRYAAANALFLDVYNQSCLSYSYTEMIDDLRQFTWDSPSVRDGSRQWTYQTCTEFGFYQSSELPDQPFGPKFPISFWVNQCSHIYGPKFSESLLQSGVNQTNIIYGGKNIRVTKVIFPNGSVDPWHYLGITQDLNNDVKAVYIEGASHCADSYPSSPDDPPQLIEAREIIRQYISTWIS